MASVFMQAGQAGSAHFPFTQQKLHQAVSFQQLGTCPFALGSEQQLRRSGAPVQNGHTTSTPLQSVSGHFQRGTEKALFSSQQARSDRSGRQANARCAFPYNNVHSSSFVASPSLRPSLFKHGLSASPYAKDGPRKSVVAKVLGGGGPDQEQGKQLGRYLGYATWGLVIWAALTGQLHWFFEGLTALSLAIFAIPLVFLLIFLGFFAYTSSKQVKGPCTSCGAELSVVTLEESMIVVDQSVVSTPVQVPINDERAFDCPSCGASLKVEDKKIVRGRPTFDSGVDTNVFSQMFGRQQAQKTGSTAASQPIVDIEAEVRDKD